MSLKIDSNVTGLRYAEEESLRTLPSSPVWYPLEPNSYSDFGGKLATVARNPIQQSRQRKKGTITDLDASGGFNQDLTQDNLVRLLQGFLFADAREKPTTQPLNDTAIAITGVTTADDRYAAASGLDDFIVGHLVKASGFELPGNNGLKVVDEAAATYVGVEENLTDETPSTDAKLEAVGYQFDEDTLDVDITSGVVLLKRASGSFDFTDLGLIPGEWIYLGADADVNKFANNAGFARVKAVETDSIELDKTDWTAANETGTDKKVRIFFGTVIKNESDFDLVKRRTYQLERALGDDDDGTMSEYLTGACPNELTINIPQASKVTFDLTFAACDNEQRSGDDDLKDGDRPDLTPSDPFNTTSDFSRIKLASVSDSESNPTPMFAFATEFTLSVKNNITPAKAIGTLGAFDTSIGTFEVGGNMTAYFADVAALQAVRNNASVTLDMAMVKQNAGIVIDVPLLILGNGRLSVEQDKPITMPLEISAAESAYHHTLLFNFFNYLPTMAG
jgi:hypothetical protein